MAKRWRRGEMLEYLRGKRALLLTSQEMGRGREYLSKTLKFDPDAYLSPVVAQEILTAYSKVK